MNVLSLFSGVGGFDLGLERAGFTVSGQAETNDKAASVLRQHWPDVQLFDDVEKVNKTNVAIKPDLICGGFPCLRQDPISSPFSPALGATSGGMRRLTPRECERLQGFPDDWTALGASPEQEVPVPLEWIGRRLKAVTK